MKINEIEVTREDFEVLHRNIKFCIESIDKGEIEKARWTLEVLENHLESNLLADKSFKRAS